MINTVSSRRREETLIQQAGIQRNSAGNDLAKWPVVSVPSEYFVLVMVPREISTALSES